MALIACRFREISQNQNGSYYSIECGLPTTACGQTPIIRLLGFHRRPRYNDKNRFYIIENDHDATTFHVGDIFQSVYTRHFPGDTCQFPCILIFTFQFSQKIRRQTTASLTCDHLSLKTENRRTYSSFVTSLFTVVLVSGTHQGHLLMFFFCFIFVSIASALMRGFVYGTRYE